eukprot:GHVU01129595.1.p1 GENE.GHVU01129595.1~~GHVU01129595.1.p1  ORF type:complete len:484 (-),score=60.79 GHVU01129595.1:862-2313(-)
MWQVELSDVWSRGAGAAHNALVGVSDNPSLHPFWQQLRNNSLLAPHGTVVGSKEVPGEQLEVSEPADAASDSLEEEELDIPQEFFEEDRGQCPFVACGDGYVHKRRYACQQQLHVQGYAVPMSNDRLSRVNHQPRYRQPPPRVGGVPLGDEGLMCGDPVGVLCAVGDRVILGVFSVVSICVGTDRVLAIDCAAIDGDVQLTGSPARLLHTEGDAMVWQSNPTNECTGGVWPHLCQLPLSLLSTLTVETDEETGDYTFSISGLQVVAETIWARHEAELVRNPGLLCTVDAAVVPMDGSGDPLLLCAAADDAFEGSLNTAPCLLCGVGVKRNDMRAHVGSHLLLSSGVVQTTMTCGFCGGEECTVDLKSAGRTKPPKVLPRCRAGYAEAFQYNACKDLKRKAICSNVPMRCSKCEDNKIRPHIYWKYNMRAHWDSCHSATPMPDEYLFNATEELQRMRAAKVAADGDRQGRGGGNESGMEWEADE